MADVTEEEHAQNHGFSLFLINVTEKGNVRRHSSFYILMEVCGDLDAKEHTSWCCCLTDIIEDKDVGSHRLSLLLTDVTEEDVRK